MTGSENHLLIDCRGLACPLPLLHTKIGLNKISVGDVMEVVTSDPISTQDIPFFLKNSSHILMKLENDENNFRFLIQK